MCTVSLENNTLFSYFYSFLSLFLTSKPKQNLFFFLPQKFCGNSVKLLRKSSVISMGVQGCLLFVFLLYDKVALQYNSLIYELCNRKDCLYVRLIFSVFIFPLIISTIQRNNWQSHQINGIPAKLLRKKNKTCLGSEVWPCLRNTWKV